jgi:hypothetical protein
VGYIHQPLEHHQDQVKQGSSLHQVLANAQLQVEDQASQVEPRAQDILVDFNLICLRIEDL